MLTSPAVTGRPRDGLLILPKPVEKEALNFLTPAAGSSGSHRKSYQHFYVSRLQKPDAQSVAFFRFSYIKNCLPLFR